MSNPKFDWKTFVTVYNDVEAHPDLASVAAALKVSYQTVRNYATLLRKGAHADLDLPALVSRKPVRGAAAPERTPFEHATIRARELAAEIRELLTTGSRYPVVNPQAVVVDAYQKRRYDRIVGGYTMVEGTPRTWLTDTLRVEPVPDPAGRRFLFTGAQNDAPVHTGFWANLKAYAAEIDADIVVGPWTYETQWWSENNPLSRAYDPVLGPHLCFGQMQLGPDLVFCGEMNTLPTANRPVSDLVTYPRGRWGIFPHAKRELHSVASTDPHRLPAQVMTTGAVTRPKVIPRKAGVKSIFHHVLGAVVVEFDEAGEFWCRQITADAAGDFYDLDTRVRAGRITKGHRAKAVVFGDVHRAKLGRERAATAFGIDLRTGSRVNQDSILDRLRPDYAFLHDVFDNQARNHHHTKDSAYAFEQAARGLDSVEAEVHQAAEFLWALDRPETDTQVMVVASNHDLALDRYVLEGRYRCDGPNVRYGLELELAHMAWREEVADALEDQREPPPFNLLEHACRRAMPGLLGHVTFLHDGQSFDVDGIECGHHGFRGANGAKGQIEGFARMSPRMSIGDKHSPGIRDGVYVAGVSELRQGYNKGPSGWSITDIVQYPDGARTLVTSRGSKWRA